MVEALKRDPLAFYLENELRARRLPPKSGVDMDQATRTRARELDALLLATRPLSEGSLEG